MSDDLPPMTGGPYDEPTEERPRATEYPPPADTEEHPRSTGYPPPADRGWASPPAWGTSPQAGWNYGYGGLWTPPPEPPAPRRPNPAQRVLATIAVIVLVLVSGSIGAVISAAVHDQSSSPPASSPFIGGSSDNNPFESDSVAPDSATSSIASKVSPALVNIYTTIETSSG